jgi:hypothetical protein
VKELHEQIGLKVRCRWREWNKCFVMSGNYEFGGCIFVQGYFLCYVKTLFYSEGLQLPAIQGHSFTLKTGNFTNSERYLLAMMIICITMA